MKIYDLLDDREQNAIQKLIDDEVTLQALEKIFTYPIYTSGTMKKGEEANPELNFALNLASSDGKSMTNEELGARLRAQVEGLRYFMTGMQNLKSFKKQEVKLTPKKNEAR